MAVLPVPFQYPELHHLTGLCHTMPDIQEQPRWAV
jgi:hypothetical protein